MTKADSGIAHSANVDQRQQHQNPQAQGERMGLQRWHGGDQRADAGGDSDRGGQHIIDHQRRRREKPGPMPQILAGHGVRAAAARIGLDRLPVRKVNDHQQAMIAALIGTMMCTPSSPSGINSVSAASGPYAAELSASRPKIGIPAEGRYARRAPRRWLAVVQIAGRIDAWRISESE